MNKDYFPPFDINTEPSTLGIRWAKWLKRLENYFIVNKIITDVGKRAALLHYAGEEVFDIFENLPNTGNEYTTAKTALNTYFSPSKNTD